MRVLALLLLAAGAAASRVFYYNHVTGQSTWERPAAMPLVDADDAPYWVVDGEVTRSPPLEYAWTRGAEGDTPYWRARARSAGRGARLRRSSARCRNWAAPRGAGTTR